MAARKAVSCLGRSGDDAGRDQTHRLIPAWSVFGYPGSMPESTLAGIYHGDFRACFITCLNRLEITLGAARLNNRPHSLPDADIGSIPERKNASDTIVDPISPPFSRSVRVSISFSAAISRLPDVLRVHRSCKGCRTV
jgi:hypothetical protein